MKDQSIFQILAKAKFLHPFRVNRIIGLLLFLFGWMIFGIHFLNLRMSDSFYPILTVVFPAVILMGFAFLVLPGSKLKIGECAENPDLAKKKPEGITPIHVIVWLLSFIGGLAAGISETLFLLGITDFSVFNIFF